MPEFVFRVDIPVRLVVKNAPGIASAQAAVRDPVENFVMKTAANAFAHFKECGIEAELCGMPFVKVE